MSLTDSNVNLGDYNDINSFVNRAAADTKQIFGDIATNEKLYWFSQFLKDYVVTAIINGRFEVGSMGKSMTGYTSGGNIPTRNVAYALTASGISNKGILPDKSCYCTVTLSSEEKVVDEAKRNKMSASLVEIRIKNVYDWFQSDPTAKNLDPNAFELIELFIMANNVKNSGGKLSEVSQQQLNELWENRKTNYVSNGIGNDNLAYKICSDCYDGELSKNNIDLASMKALQTIAGVDLWMNQEKRNCSEVRYDNVDQLTEIMNYIGAAKLTGADLSVYISPFIQRVEAQDKNLEDAKDR